MSENREQQLLINEDKRNVLLLASAGTGKTDTLAKRIAKLIEDKKAKAEEILCITFTNKACKEMQERVEKIVRVGAKGITIKTFHSFCFDIVKAQAKKRTDIFTDFLVFDEEDCKELIKSCNYYNYPLAALQQFIDFVKLERVRTSLYSEDSKNDYMECIKEIFKNNEEKINSICSERGVLNQPMKEFLKEKGHILITTYNLLLFNNHGLDFSDLIVRTKELFNDKDVVSLYRDKFKYINIDEVQDTSTLEYSIIEKLFGGNNILVCGDIFQTIYGWRGSNPNKIFSEYKEKYKPLEIIFKKNYRGTKNLTNASLGFLKKSFPDEINEIYKEEIKAESPQEGEKIFLKIADGGREEARYIFEEVKKLEESRADISKACILTRDNRYNISLSRHLENIIKYEGANFEFILVDQFRFFRRQEIKDIIAFLKLIANRYDAISLKRIVDRLPTGVGDKSFEEIESNEYKRVGISLPDFIDENVIKYGEKYSLLINEYEEENIIVFDVESTGIDVTEDEIIQIAAIKINKKGEVVRSFEKFLRNKRSVKSSEKVHGFSDEFLSKNGEEKENVLKEFVEFSKGAIIVGHNVQFDINILTSELNRANLGTHKFKGFYDTLDIYRRFHPNLINHKLETLSKYFKTENIPSHDAMDDILATSELLVRAINEDIKPTSMERIAYMTKHIKAFTKITEKLNDLFKKAEGLRPCDIVATIINDFNIKSLYTGEEGREKIERLRDFYVLLKDLDQKEKSNRDSLLDIIKITGLSNGDLESLLINRTKKPRIPIITVHQAKGLEFENVFIAGAQESTFPSYMSIRSNNLMEEKRTFYVALTRAKKRLYITSNIGDSYGRKGEISRFIKLIPREYIKKI